MALNISDLFKQTDVRETETSTAPGPVSFDMDYAQYDCTYGAGGTGMYISPNGQYMYLGSVGSVKQYTLSNSWDISTATLTRTLDVSAKSTDLSGLSFKVDGLKMYVLDKVDEFIYEYNLSTAWDISTAVFLQDSGSIHASSWHSDNLWLRADGRQVYVSSTDLDTLQTLFLSTAWDITSWSAGASFAASNPKGMFCSPDGVYVFSSNSTSMWRWTMGTPFRVSSAASQLSFVSCPAITVNAVYFKGNGKLMYLLDSGAIQQYKIKKGWR